jgi:hypothetical protein
MSGRQKKNNDRNYNHIEDLKTNQIKFTRYLRQKSSEKSTSNSLEEKNYLQSLFQFHISKIDPSNFAETISLISIINEKITFLYENEFKLIVKNLERVTQQLSANDLALLFVSLARININYKQLQYNLKLHYNPK